MKCPHCNHDGKALVSESRQVDGDVYRRRHCGKCGKEFVSKEVATLGKFPATRLMRPKAPHQSRSKAIHSITVDASHLDGVWR